MASDSISTRPERKEGNESSIPYAVTWIANKSSLAASLSSHLENNVAFCMDLINSHGPVGDQRTNGTSRRSSLFDFLLQRLYAWNIPKHIPNRIGQVASRGWFLQP